MQCIFHKGEFITNFCKSDRCLLPLCPVCVKLHSQEHAKSDRFGVFQLIDVCVTQAQEEMATHCQKLNMCRSKLTQINQIRKQHQARIVQQVREAKLRIFDEIQREFQQFQHQLNLIMDQKENQFMGLVARITEMSEHSCQDCQGSMLNLRNPDSCLQSLIHYYYYQKEREQEWDNIILSINQKIRQCCQNRALEVLFNPEALQNVKGGLISGFINLSSMSIPLPCFQIPMVTSASKAQYIAVEKCCLPFSNIPKSFCR